MNANLLDTTTEETSANLRDAALDSNELNNTVTSRRSNTSIAVSQDMLNTTNVSAIRGIEEMFGPRTIHQDLMTPKSLKN